MFWLQISRETVPDLLIAKIDFDNVLNLISGSEIISILSIFVSFRCFSIKSFVSLVAWNTKFKFFNLLLIKTTDFNKIGNKISISDFLLPGNIDTIFLELSK